MKQFDREFLIQEIEELKREDTDKFFLGALFISLAIFIFLAWRFSTMEPPVEESDFFDKLDEEVKGNLVVMKKEEKKKPQKKKEKKKKEKKKVEKDRKGKKKLRESDRVASGGSRRGGGDPRARVTAKGVLGIVSGKIKGPAIADADPFGKGGFASDIDAILMGTGGLKRGGGGGIGRKGVAGIGFGTGYGSGFGGGAGGVDDLLGSLAGGVGTVKLKKRGKIKAVAPSSITGDAEGGGRSKEEIRRVVLKHLGGLKYLYNKYLKKNPNLKGKITVKMVIAPSGKVIKVVILESTLNCPDLEREIVRAIKRWRFRRIPKGTVTVIYPFHFTQ